MSSMRSYTPEFREAAVALVKSQGLSIRKAADRLGISFHTLDNWIRRGRPKRTVQVPSGSPKTLAEAAARVRSLEADVRRLTLEREILKKRRRTLQRSNREVRVPPRRVERIVHHAHGVPVTRSQSKWLLPFPQGTTCSSQATTSRD